VRGYRRDGGEQPQFRVASMHERWCPERHPNSGDAQAVIA